MTLRNEYISTNRGHFKGILNLGYDGSSFYEQDVDAHGRISVKSYKWNTVTLDWEPVTGSSTTSTEVSK